MFYWSNTERAGGRNRFDIAPIRPNTLLCTEMRNVLIISTLLVTLLYASGTYVYEGKHIVKPVYFRQEPTVLYATAGFGQPSTYDPPTPSITRFQVFPPGQKHRGTGAIKSSYRIPPTFVRSAQLHSFNSMYTDRILTKPKRWAISTVYDKPVDEKLAGEEIGAETTTPHVPTITTTTTDATTEPPTSTDKAENPDSRLLFHPEPVVRDTRADEENKQYTVQLSTEQSPIREESVYREPVVPDHLIKQNYLPASEEQDYLAQFEMEGYQPVLEPEVHEPMWPVRHSSAPWAYRDVYRSGSPRHPACSQPLDRGVGPDEISSWYYDTQLNICRWFGFRGYGGNSNRFYSRTACESLCILDIENMCETVKCSFRGMHCSMAGDEHCRQREEMNGRDWRLHCPPDQPVCLGPRGIRIAPDIEYRNIPQECFQQKDSGSCVRKNPAVMFYYDRERNDCMTFYYHNCGGNDNRFETKTDCMSYCSP